MKCNRVTDTPNLVLKSQSQANLTKRVSVVSLSKKTEKFFAISLQYDLITKEKACFTYISNLSPNILFKVVTVTVATFLKSVDASISARTIFLPSNTSTSSKCFARSLKKQKFTKNSMLGKPTHSIPMQLSY